MKTLFVYFLSCLFALVANAQVSVAEYKKDIQSNNYDPPKAFPVVSCDSMYRLLTHYMHQKDRWAMGKAVKALTDLYNQTENKDSCSTIRIQIVRDYLNYIQADTLNSIDSQLSSLGSILSKDEIKRLGGREIILSVYKRKGLRASGLADFILPFHLTELLPLYWDLFKNTNPEENGGNDKAYLLLKMIELGDSSAIELYGKTLWNYTKIPGKFIEDPYFYQLLNRVRLTKNKILTKQLFEMLDYLQNHDDKKIYYRYDSDTDKPIYWSLTYILFSEALCQNVVNLPNKHCDERYPQYIKANVDSLLKWYWANPDRIILK